MFSPTTIMENFRNRLSNLDALPQFALLGVLSGVGTGVIIVVFRMAIEIPLRLALAEGDPDNFEALQPITRFIAPLLGAIIIGLLLSYIGKDNRAIGVTHTLERLNFHEANLPLRNAFVQFVVGVISLVSGNSAGREGPAIHLGTAFNSFVGRRLSLPNNSIRVLVGCGTAAAIAASFNTPIAGVIFAMEVVMMEYTIAGFTPVILSAVSATVVTRIVYGHEVAFEVPALAIQSLWDLPFTILMGFILGALASLFIKIVKLCAKLQHYHFMLRVLIAGTVSGVLAVLVPASMGVGYDSVAGALAGQMGWQILCGLVLAKILATAISVGLGMPYGLIGPIVVIGAAAGAALGILGNLLIPQYASEVGLYSMLGMGAMMGAVLQAPLAALMALLELTGNPNIILPGMLIIVVANLTARAVFKQHSVFQEMLGLRGISLNQTPVLQALRRVGVVSLMNDKCVSQDQITSVEDARKILKTSPDWIVITKDRKPISLLPAIDLARHLADKAPIDTGTDPEADVQEPTKLDLKEIPARRRDLAAIHRQATLQEAFDTLHKAKVEALYVERVHAPMITSVMGIVTRDDIENYYLHK